MNAGLAIPLSSEPALGPPAKGILSSEYLARLERPIRGLRIALAEDDDDIREEVARLLRREGHEVIEASDGLELFELVEAAIWLGGRERAPLSLILTDAHMPGFSGIDVLWILRAAFWEVPVVLMTDAKDHASRAEALSLGASGVVEKPVQIGDLRRIVRVALRGPGISVGLPSL